MKDVLTMARRERREHLLQFYAPSFKDHKITVQADENESVALYTCRSATSGYYWFHVVLAPGALFLYGDVGDLALRVSPPHDALGLRCWLRDATRDAVELDYLLGKSPHPEWEFGVGELRRYLREEAAEGLKPAELRALREWGDHFHHGEPITQEAWAEAWYNATGGDVEPPDFNDWSSQMLCQFLALYHFIRLVPEEAFHA